MKELRTRMGRKQTTPSNAIPGFWVIPFGDYRSSIPAAIEAPTGCVLPDTKCERPTITFRALDMYPLDTRWLIMSKWGLWTYRHSTELSQDRLVLFVPIDEWPLAYQAKLVEPVAKSAIGKEFGKEAAKVAPVQEDAVCLLLTRYDGSQRLHERE